MKTQVDEGTQVDDKNSGMPKTGSYSNKKINFYPLPDYGYTFFDHLKAEYENKLLESLSESSKGVIKAIDKKREELKLSWSEVYSYESIFMRVVHDDELPRKAWDLRNRYREIVGLKEYEAYLASKPPEISGLVEAEKVRSDINFLLYKIYLHYSLTPYDERLRNSISKKVTGSVLLGLFLIFVTVLVHWLISNNLSGYSIKPAPILIVIYAGAMGGLMSMLQRFSTSVREGDPINGLPHLMQYWSRVFTPAINGALFAALLYVIFVAGLIDGTLFPSFNHSDVKTTSFATARSFLIDSAPTAFKDYAKLIVWSFIAGFAERFVPDALTKIVSKKENTSVNPAV